ncbi:MAG: 2'-5' RNA ligase family protein [Patescibacteria group bacterium]
MRYFIAHLLRGPIAEYHRMLVYDVATRFDLKISAGYFPSHITIKEPFEATAERIDDLKNMLVAFSRTYHIAPFTIYGFGCFGDRVIFLDVTLSTEASRISADLQDVVIKNLVLLWGKYEPLKNFHLTIAKNDVAEKFDDIWGYLMTKHTPTFNLSFDNIALFRREEDAWVVESIYPLSP